MCSFKFVNIVILLMFVVSIHGEISDKRLCADPNCSEPISLAKSLLKYSSPHPKILAFPPNVEFKIFSKSAGSNLDLWGAEIKGKRGYIPKAYVRELRIFTNKLDHLVDTEYTTEKSDKVPSVLQNVAKEKLHVEPNPVQQPFEVVAGTTIFSEDPISPSSTDSPIQATALPPIVPQNNILINGGSIEGTNGGKLQEANREQQKEVVEDINHSKHQDIVENDSYETSEEEDGDEEDDEGYVEEDEDEDGFEDDDSIEQTLSEVIDMKQESKLNKVLKEAASAEKPGNILITESEAKKPETPQITETVVPIDKHQTEERKQTISDDLKENSTTLEQDMFSSREVETVSEDIKDTPTSEENLESIPVDVQVSTESQVLLPTTTEHNEIANKEATIPHYTEAVVANSMNVQTDLKENGKSSETILEKVEQAAANKENLEIIPVQVTTEIPNIDLPLSFAEMNVIPKPLENNAVADGSTLDYLSKNQEKTIGQIEEAPKKNEDNLETKPADVQVTTPIPSIDLPLPFVENNVTPTTTESNILENNLGSGIENLPETFTIPPEINDPEKVVEQKDEKAFVNLTASAESEVVNPNIAADKEQVHDSPNSSVEALSANKNESTDENAEKVQNSTEGQEQTNEINITESSHQLASDSLENKEVEIHKKEESEEKLAEESTESGGFLKGMFNYFEATTENSSHVEQLGGDSIQQDIISDANVEGNTEGNENGDSAHTNELRNTNPITEEVGISVDVGTKQENEFSSIQLASDIFLPAVEPEQEFIEDNHDVLLSKKHEDVASCQVDPTSTHCHAEERPKDVYDVLTSQTVADSINMDFSEIYSLLVVLGITGACVVIFLWGYIFIDKSRREAPLIAKINSFEKAMLIAKKENQILNNKLLEMREESHDQADAISNELVLELRVEVAEAQTKCAALEEEKQSLEKELENSTEVGLELNRMLTDMLSSQNGSDTLISNVEQLQRQLVEQQGTINTVNASLNDKNTENHEMQLELEICNKKVTELQIELHKMAESLLKLEEEKDQCLSKLETEIQTLQETLAKTTISQTSENIKLKEEFGTASKKCHDLRRSLELKTHEYNILKDSLNEDKQTKKLLEDATFYKAQHQQVAEENVLLTEQLKQEQESKYSVQTRAESARMELEELRLKYQETDKNKLEVQTKLHVLQNYFKEKEAQMQKEISKHESMFMEKQGEATSTTERIKFMQSELQNYKSQYESLKQELVAQEVELKSQISVLEQRAHENWVAARQAERKLEDTKQESAQLRNRLTLRERNFTEDKGQNRIQSPLEQNGEMTVSPLHMSVESPSSPPLLYGTLDHLTTSPPMPGLPPFLPPPPGVPFMPPLSGVPPPFMPPPPTMFPGDHRPPPLGRMSSPPLIPRYSPDSRAYSPYDRNSPSLSYDDEYGSSPPPLHRGYSPYNHRDDRRDYKRPPPVRNNMRNHKGSNVSSGSANSNESIEKINGRHHSRV